VSALSSGSAALAEHLRHSRRRLLVVAAVLLVAIGIVVATTDPFAGKHASSGIVDNGAPTALQTVQRRSLTARQTVNGTLGYAGVWTVAVPAGTSAADLQQAEEQAVSASAAYVTARASLSGDEQTLDTTEAELQAARLKEESDCAGANAAVSASPSADTAPANSAASASGASACVSSMQAAQTDQDAIPSVRQKAAADRTQLASARATLASAQRALDTARSASAAYGSSATYTMLPALGDVIRRGQTLYAINGSDTLLLYGATPAWRSLAAGVKSGHDVAELNANLRILGYGSAVGDSFTSSTEQGIEALQRSHHLLVTGSLPLGSVVFEPNAARVTAVTPTVGQSVQPGSIIGLSSTRHDVSIQLDASQQSQVKVGDRVLISLPDNSTTPGVVASVGKVATVPSGQGSDGNAPPGSPSIPVDVRLLHPRDAGTLDQAPVNVLITTERVSNALVVPVDALVALAGGGYAVEEVTAGRTHRLVPVTPGLFDDEAGLVQVSGGGVAAGQRIVVPAS
jgi:hypothetical protein